MRIEISNFAQLTTTQLYELLQLRSAVFVVEQDCVYQDVDGKDQRATHVMGYENDVLVAYTRVFAAGDYFDQASIGRVVVSGDHRGRDYGKKIMEASINYLKEQKCGTIKISAQCYLDQFYKDLGFTATGENYLEDGISHQAMIYGNAG
ncbi:MAG: GNAT family N-acetyltransferase [Nonlabens sp.]